MPLSAFHPNDVGLLLGMYYEGTDSDRAHLDLASRVALQLNPADLSAHFGPWIMELAECELFEPLDCLLRGLLSHGTPEQLVHLRALDLQPMLTCRSSRIRELAFDFLSELPSPEQQKHC